MSQKIKIRYVRNNKRVPRGVVVVDINTRQTGWSYCTNEVFLKKKAVQLAMERLGKIVECKEIPRDIQKETKDVMLWLDKNLSNTK